jgi:hypothetical protein
MSTREIYKAYIAVSVGNFRPGNENLFREKL